ncbi:hypothetical protein D3C76_847710 [compost metagenome]
MPGGLPAQLAAQFVLAMAGENERLALRRPGQAMAGRRGAAGAVAILGLQPRGQAHALPFALVQLAVAIAVEASEQAGEVALPFADHRRLRAVDVQALAAAAAGMEIAQRVQRLAGLQALLGIAVVAAAAEQLAEQPRRLRHAARMAFAAFPAFAGERPHISAGRVDQAHAGGVAQAEPALADALLQRAPVAAALVIALLFLDAVAPPQARLAGQRAAQRRFGAFLEDAVEFGEALRGGTHLRGRHVGQQARPGEVADAAPAAVQAGAAGHGEEDPLAVELHAALSRTGP